MQAAVSNLKQLNSEPLPSAAERYIPFPGRFSGASAVSIMQSRRWSVVLDCSDNPATRYLASDLAVLFGIPLISGAAQRAEGQLMTLNYPAASGPCYRCIFPTPPAPETVQTCSEIGILGPVVGTIGVMMATECVKVLVADETARSTFKPSMLLYNAFSGDPKGLVRVVGMRRRRKECVACRECVGAEGGKEKITVEKIASGELDYGDWCGRMEDVKVLREEDRIAPEEFLKSRWRSRSRSRSSLSLDAANTCSGQEDIDGASTNEPLIVDVREEVEYAIGTKIQGSINVPISKILRQRDEGPRRLDELLQTANATSTLATEGYRESQSQTQPQNQDIIFVCQRGNDSQLAAKKFIDAFGGHGSERRFVDIKGGFVALQRLNRAA